MVTASRPPVLKPCSDCPFRRKAMPGWLGAGSPESFVACMQRDEPLPCHQTINYDDLAWKEKWVAQTTGSACAGALIMAANQCKRPRDPAFPRMPADTALVFTTPLEFIRFHRDSTVRSWDEDDQDDEAKELRKLSEEYAKAQGKPINKHTKKRSRR